MTDVLKNITLVGASGNLGSKALESLLKSGKHNVSAITRPSSTSQYPAEVTVKQGEYDNNTFMDSALRDQDVLVILLGFPGLPYQDGIIEAAARAGVKYVLPAEYGIDSTNEKIEHAADVIQAKKKTQQKIEGLGMKWIAVITGPWIDYCIPHGIFDIVPAERKATVYTDSATFSTTTVSQIGAAIAACLALPRATIDAEFANNCLYVSSFRMTQPELFSRVLRVSGTTEEDWSVERQTVRDLIDQGYDMVKAGQSLGYFKLVFGATYQRGNWGDHSGRLHNEMLGLQEEDLDEVLRMSIAAAKPGEWKGGDTLGKHLK